MNDGGKKSEMSYLNSEHIGPKVRCCVESWIPGCTFRTPNVHLIAERESSALWSRSFTSAGAGPDGWRLLLTFGCWTRAKVQKSQSLFIGPIG